jgi:putative ATP-binding cassette transporter
VHTIIDLVSFSIILFSVMPQLFIAIIVFATLGTAATVVIGRILVKLNYEALQREADFRFSLVRIRENAESIAFYGGEPVEERFTKQKFQRAIDNSNQINVAQRNLDVFITSYNHLTEILPTIILANQYFNGIIEFGVVAQVRGAFWHILNDFSVIIREFNGIAGFMAGLDRLFLFMKAIQKLDPDRPNDDAKVMTKDIISDSDEDDGTSPQQHVIRVKEKRTPDPAVAEPVDPTHPSTILSMRDVRLVTPDNKRVLVQNLDLSLLRGRNMLIAGVSGSGKSSLLRAIAGLWNNGSGEIARPSNDHVYFLPQRPYCPPGSLRDQLLYPSTELSDNYDGTQDGWSVPIEQRRVEWSSMSDAELLDVLDAVDLPDLASRIGDGDPIRGLNTVLDYSNTLSLGEQQRLAFGRVVINRPSLVILGESTSACDVVTERKMYSLLKKIAADAEDGGRTGLTYVSVGHRPTLLQHHDVKLLLRDGSSSVSYIQQSEISSEEETILS